MRTARTACTTLLIALAAATAHAQTHARNELSVFGGISLMDALATEPRRPYLFNQSPLAGLIYPFPFGRAQKLGASVEFGARYGRDLTTAVALTGDFSVAPAHELTEYISHGCPHPLVCIAQPTGLTVIGPDYTFSERVTAYHYGGGLRLNLRPGLLTPSVIAGVGGVTFAGASHRNSDLAVRLGGSLTAAVRNLTTGVEVVDTIVADHYVTGQIEHDVHVRLSFGVRW